MGIEFAQVTPRGPADGEWNDWKWQFRQSLRSQSDFAAYFDLSAEEIAGFEAQTHRFRSQTTPYYAALACPQNPEDPIRKILMPRGEEALPGAQEMLDPLGERQPANHKASRLIHRYSDRVLFLVTDLCSVYCRYCTRKHFTASDQAFLKDREKDEAIAYIRSHPGIREVIFSGGDPLTLADGPLDRLLFEVRQIPHVEIIRIHSRMPVVAPMRITEEFVKMLRKHKPVFLITHFNHPREISADAAMAVENLVDHGVPVLNQMVLLNGINNTPAHVQALSRRLLYLRAKPYYMFQCDPSLGTDHLRTSIDDSLEIQRELWGHLSGLAMPSLIVDIPNGGGKASLTPNFQLSHSPEKTQFRGWDGVEAEYHSPAQIRKPMDTELYQDEWERLKAAKQSL